MSALREALRDLPDAVFADLLESEDAYLVVLDFPGTTSATVDASIGNGKLHVEARREKDVPSEFRYLSEDRSLFLDVELPVPTDATGDDPAASIEQGVLEIRLPKQSAASATTIPVRDR